MLARLGTLVAPYLNVLRIVGIVISIAVIWWAVHAYNERLREQGRAEVRAEVSESNTAEYARLTKLAEDARHANFKELNDLRVFRDTHPIDLWVPVKLPSISIRTGAPTVIIDGGTGAGATDVFPVSEGDPVQRNVGPLLSALASRCDQVAASLREYQSR